MFSRLSAAEIRKWSMMLKNPKTLWINLNQFYQFIKYMRRVCLPSCGVIDLDLIVQKSVLSATSKFSLDLHCIFPPSFSNIQRNCLVSYDGSWKDDISVLPSSSPFHYTVSATCNILMTLSQLSKTLWIKLNQFYQFIKFITRGESQRTCMLLPSANKAVTRSPKCVQVLNKQFN